DDGLGLAEAERGELADDLDDLDLLLAGGLEHDVERRLLLDLFDGGGTGSGGAGNGDRSGGGDLEGLLELLHELRQLDERELLERVEQLVGAELRHGGVLSVSYTRGADADSTRPRALGGVVSALGGLLCRTGVRRGR